MLLIFSIIYAFSSLHELYQQLHADISPFYALSISTGYCNVTLQPWNRKESKAKVQVIKKPHLVC